MSVRLVLSPEDRIVTYDVFGRVSIDTIMACRQVIRDLPDSIRRCLNQLIRYRNTAELDLKPDQVKQFALLEAGFSAQSIRVFLTADPLAFSMLRMYAVLKEGASGTFRFAESLDEASSLLGLPSDVIHSILRGERGETLALQGQ